MSMTNFTAADMPGARRAPVRPVEKAVAEAPAAKKPAPKKAAPKSTAKKAAPVDSEKKSDDS